MAVKSNMPKLASQFWPLFIKQKTTLVIVIQVIFSIIIVLSLVFMGAAQSNPVLFWAISNPILFWVIIAGLLIIQLVINLLILNLTTRPTRDLMAAITKIAGEQSALTPPNPNDEKYESSGFRDALQTVYELASKENNDLKKSDTTSTQISGALDNTPCGFVVLNSDRKITYHNKSAPIHTDSEGEKSMELIFNGTDTLEKWLDSCEENDVHAEKLWIRIPDKLPNQEGRRFYDVIASYQKGSDAETVLTLIDRTKSYITDEENLDFISFAAHELRGPITVIRGYLDVLADELAGAFQDDQQELFHRLIVSANRLSGYIDNILNTSSYDRRHLKMNLVEDTVSGIYDTIKDDMELRAGAQNRLLNVNIPTDLPTIAADRGSISEVFGNLIDNALKYSNEGGVVNVTAKVSGNYVDISVEDNGIGMPESVISNLFQKFYRSHRSRETVAGTGIGLYISKAIVESHGGTISVRSEDGRGSTFTVSLPIYSTVADKLKAGNNSNEGLISEGTGWIKNHSMYRG